MFFTLIFRTKLLKKIYDEYDLNVRMHEKPVGFTLTNKNNESNYTYRSKFQYLQYIFFLGLETHDYETMKNVDDIKDLKSFYHSNEGRLKYSK